MRKLFQILTFISLSAAMPAEMLYAQSKVLIRGKVVDKSSAGAALVGVSIIETDKDNRTISGTQSDMSGSYSLTVQNVAGHKLVFSYLGYKSQTIAIDSKAVINVSLEESSTDIDEVVISAQKQVRVGALGIDERDMTYAYSKLDTKDIDALPVTSVDQALQGRLAGVDIVANSGQPGSGMSIRIRGTASINNNSDPLIVVNGLPYETTISSDFDFATADEENYSQLLNISPSDIQEITVLKDAASTAMYGSKGANGVLMITTKRGSMGKPRLSYSFKGTVSAPRDAIPTLNGDQYSTLILESAANAGSPLNLDLYPEFARDPNNPYDFYNYGQNTDWVSEVQKTAFKQEHNFALSGGGEKALYRISAGYLSEDGNIINTSYNRFTTTLNLSYQISDRIRVVADMSYVHGESNNAFMKDLLATTYTKMPSQSVYEYTTEGVLTPNYFSPAETPQGSFLDADLSKNEKGIYNPVAMAYESSRAVIDDRVRPVFTLQYQILPGKLEYTGTVGFDISSKKNKGSLPQVATGRPWIENSVNRAQDADEETFIVQINNTLSFVSKITEWAKLNSLVKLNTTDKQTEAFSALSSNTASIYLTDPSNLSRLISPNSGMSQERQVQATMFVGWSFFDRYIIDGVITADGNSRFGPSYRFGYFPSLSGRWRISGEPYVRELKFLNDLSLRASYGQSGKVPDKNYLYYNRYSSYTYSYLNELGVYPTGMTLSNLRWEMSSELNLGANLIAFNNRVNIDFNWYRKTTNDLLFEKVGIPNVSGVSSIYMNVGTMDNDGWELSIFTTPLKRQDWQVDFRVQLSRNQNMIRSLSDNVPLSTTATADNGKFMARIQEGNPLGSFYGYRYEGVYLNDDQTIARGVTGEKIYTYNDKGELMPVQMQFWYPTNGYVFKAGDAKYGDINHDGNIDYMDIVYLGNANPLLYGGFGPSIRYKGWSLDAYFYFRYGFDIVNSTKMEMEKMNDFSNQSTAVLRRWTHPYDNPEEAPEGLLPRALFRDGYNWLGSDRYVEDGSFMKFKSLTLRYSFDKALVKKIGLSDLGLNFTVYNLYTWTNYTGMNPEVSIRNVSKDIYSIGYDESKAPSNIEFMFGINATF
ncbi:MAG: SusC/RagA family TonB-linked outer membrane protein [Prevotellaceae bacterium]|jgi:TonB-linked SusC/RagA family outer membrane protein|nr:SusC/RagA family TonB-linked outer membrane protein [Prevotellaceae bacterium]